MTLVLLFTLGDQLYGLEITSIQEIVENPVRHYVPRATGILQSAINVHGRILPVVDLLQLLAFDSSDRDHRLVVLTPSCYSLALIVSRVGRIEALDLSLLEPSPADAVQQAVRGVIQHNERPVNMLDTDELICQLKQSFTEEGG